MYVCSVSTLSQDVSLYADAGWIFAQHFCNRLGPAYLALKDVLNEANPGHAEVLNQIKKRFREETFTPQRILEAIHAYPELVGVFCGYVQVIINVPLCTDPHALCQFCDGSLSEFSKVVSARVSQVLHPACWCLTSDPPQAYLILSTSQDGETPLHPGIARQDSQDHREQERPPNLRMFASIQPVRFPFHLCPSNSQLI